jgi:hypothetical protein
VHFLLSDVLLEYIDSDILFLLPERSGRIFHKTQSASRKDTPIQVNLLFLVAKNGGMEKQGSCVVSNLRTQLEWGANRDSFRLKNRFNTSYCF